MGEGVRLKLLTPLFVADALMGAAGQRIEADLAAAKVRALKLKQPTHLTSCPYLGMHAGASRHRRGALTALSC